MTKPERRFPVHPHTPLPRRHLQPGLLGHIRRFSTHVFGTWKFHVTKSRFRKCIGTLRVAPRIAWRWARKICAEISVAPRKRVSKRAAFSVIFRNIFRMHQCRGIREQHLSATRIALRAEESRARANPRQVNMFFGRVFRVFSPLPLTTRYEYAAAAPVCSCANTRGHAEEIACYSSIRSHGTFL